MLKILQICNKAPFPANDGSSIAIYNMSQGLLANGVSLHVMAINTKKHFKPDEGVPAGFREKTHYTSVYRNTNISAGGAILNLFSTRSYFVSRFRFKAFAKKLAALLKENSFDIVQLEGLFMGVYLDVIRKNSEARIVLRAHNIEHYIWKRHISAKTEFFKRSYLLLQNKRLKAFELGVLSQVDAVVPISETDAAGFRKLGCAKPLHTCITGVDISMYQAKSGRPEKSKTVFYFGSMDWLPNQQAVTWFLQNCWEEIHRAVPDAKLIIAGRGMPLHFFHITAPNVSIIENIEDAGDFYRQHQVMIVPLLSGSGLRIKIIEGMAYGKAIVSTSVGAEGIGCTHNTNILIADSAPSFSDAVIRLLREDAERKRLEKAAASFAAEEFDNSKVVSGLIDFYLALCHG